MKVKEARELLEGYTGDLLYQQGHKLFRSVLDNLITLRAHGKKPNRGVIESAIDQMEDWFTKVAEGLSWESVETPKSIIQWETSDAWVRYSIVDPVVDNYRKRARLEVLKGSPLPLLTALTPEALDAITGMMVSKVVADMKVLGEQEEARKKMAERIGKRVCPYGAEERFCVYQETYSLINPPMLPTSVNDLVFVCITNQCYKE